MLCHACAPFEEADIKVRQLRTDLSLISHRIPPPISLTFPLSTMMPDFQIDFDLEMPTSSHYNWTRALSKKSLATSELDRRKHKKREEKVRSYTMLKPKVLGNRIHSLQNLPRFLKKRFCPCCTMRCEGTNDIGVTFGRWSSSSKTLPPPQPPRLIHATLLSWAGHRWPWVIFA